LLGDHRIRNPTSLGAAECANGGTRNTLLRLGRVQPAYICDATRASQPAAVDGGEEGKGGSAGALSRIK